ncbi:MAG TPA: hypothetical protein VLX92_24095 [Kofleriaceae bacterium]|nr:hypothetical protein [Kofleriaceae bacterium]
MKRWTVWLAFALGCGSSKPAPVPPQPPLGSGGAAASAGSAGSASAGSASAPAAPVPELKFYEGDNMGLHVARDGKLEIENIEAGKPKTWKTVGTMKADGTVVADDGSYGNLLPDGTFKMSTGQSAPFQISGDALIIQGKKITIDDKGNVLLDGATPPGGAMRVEGVVDAQSRRLALLVLGLLVSSPGEEPAAGKTP